jgi:predicted glycoside hydrolase/deacetylase ChbG (UPF0249 family)
MSEHAALRRIWLCADDYGLSSGVNRGIRDLIERQRLNATSVMVVGAAIARDDIHALKAVTSDARCAIGLHVTLTAPFHPLTMYYRPLLGGAFASLSAMLRASLLRQLDREIIHAEIAAQLTRFIELFGHPPDYVDGHQHVQLFPQVREVFLAAVKDAAPKAWVRQCGRPRSSERKFGNPKALLLDILSARFRTLSSTAGLTFNPAFSGAYDFTREQKFGDIMPGFLQDLPDQSLVMCHPGFVDATLIELDPLTHQREQEYKFLMSDEFQNLLTAQSIALFEPPPRT